MKVEGISESTCHEVRDTHDFKHYKLYPCSGLQGPKLVFSGPELLENLRGDFEVQDDRGCSPQLLIPRGCSRDKGMFAIPVMKEHASLEDLAKDRSANAQVDVP